MNDLIDFNFDEQPVRAILFGNHPWFVANDVAKVLGYRSFHMTRMLDDDEKGIHNMDTLGGEQSLTIISESGLFAAILKSRRPEAKRFRKWVTQDVLPTLRRTGRYDLTAEPFPQPQEFDTARLSASVAVVREARRLWGVRSARGIWAQLGLPVAIADAQAHADADPLVPAISKFLETSTGCTIDECGEALGLEELENSTRLRIGRILRMMGWFPAKVRRGPVTVNLFTPPVNWRAARNGEELSC